MSLMQWTLPPLSFAVRVLLCVCRSWRPTELCENSKFDMCGAFYLLGWRLFLLLVFVSMGGWATWPLPSKTHLIKFMYSFSPYVRALRPNINIIFLSWLLPSWSQCIVARSECGWMSVRGSACSLTRVLRNLMTQQRVGENFGVRWRICEAMVMASALATPSWSNGKREKFLFGWNVCVWYIWYNY